MFRESWRESQIEKNCEFENSEDGNEQRAANTGGKNDDKPKNKAANSSNGGGRGKRKNEADDDTTNREKERRKIEQKMIKKDESGAIKVVNLYRQHILSAKSLVSRIDAEAEWEWARTPKLSGGLKQTIAELDGLITGDRFIQDFVTMDVKEVKKAWSDFADHLKHVTGKLQEPVDRLASTCARLSLMHKSNLEYST